MSRLFEQEGLYCREKCLYHYTYLNGSIMVWGCFAVPSVGDLLRIDGVQNKGSYREILEAKLFRLECGFVFQQDTDPKLASKLCHGYLEEIQREDKVVIMTSKGGDINESKISPPPDLGIFLVYLTSYLICVLDT